MSKRRKSSRKAKRKSRIAFKKGKGFFSAKDFFNGTFTEADYKAYLQRLKANSKVIKVNPEDKVNDGVITYQLNPVGLLDTSASTNTQQNQIIEIKKTLDDAVKISPPYFGIDERLAQIVGNHLRPKTLKEEQIQKDRDQTIRNTIAFNRLSRPIRPVVGNRDVIKRIKDLIQKLLKFYNVKNVKDLIPIYLKAKPNSHIRSTLYFYSFTEVSTFLRHCGLRPNEVLHYSFERMFATKANKIMHNIRKAPLINRFENGRFINDDENPQDGIAGIELVSQWLIYSAHNKHYSSLNWKQKKEQDKPKYTMSMFHKSKWYAEWCIRYQIPFEKHYPAFTKFLKQAIKDYRRYQVSVRKRPVITSLKTTGQL